MATISVDKMELPRLELRWTRKGKTWRAAICTYNLVLPLAEHDVRRELNSDSAMNFVIPLSFTKRPNQGVSPYREGCGAVEESIDEPFRQTAHAIWDARSLGGLPIYVICEDRAMRIVARASGQKPETQTRG
jgi:hypothetical protein